MGSLPPSASVTLREAVKRFADPELLRAWLDALDRRKQGNVTKRLVWTKSFVRGGPVPGIASRGELEREVRRAHTHLRKNLWTKVRGGELVLWGRKDRPDSPLDQIEVAIQYFEADFRTSKIIGPEGLKYYDIHIAQRDALASEERAKKSATVPRSRIDREIKQRVEDWNPATNRIPLKSEVFGELKKTVGKVSKREFDQRWAEYAHPLWKRSGRRKTRQQ